MTLRRNEQNEITGISWKLWESDLCEMLTDRQMDGQTDGRFAMMIAHADL